MPCRTMATAVVGLLALTLSACTKSVGDGPADAGASAQQQVEATSGDASLCTPERYNGGVPQLDLKNVTVGFAQSEKEANPFRITETQSIKDEAARRGIKLITTNAQSDLNKEIADIQGMIAQGAKVLIISPLNSEGLDPALKAAQDAKVPIMTIDRLLTTKKACVDYIGWIGSDFVKQGARAADAMITATGDKGEVAILLGASGVNVTVDRTKGFKDQLAAKGSALKVVAEQTGDFTREKGRAVTEQLISANPGISAIYAENDEMALGAVAALKAAGKKPGDVKIVTIDGTRGAVQGIVDGWIAAVIESNPRFGPLAFQALEDFYAGKGVPAKTIISDKEYTPENAKAELANAY
ncbi:ABC transporter substrate-binding protein [Nonomuraea sp. SYSU D8015]|uniref:ABC transporter substrate-binding protein n=1 Tax=Nonomuraea sp. SYSU D8015 TaxID=2593644 RepID=UPI001660C743|nr:ABC transporter substrate-binding protein [Nonomuraea sp. SYSU D8015]